MVAQGQKSAAWVLFAGSRLSKGSYSSRDSLWGREAFPVAVAAHGGGKKAGGCGGGCWGSVGSLSKQQLEAHKEEREKRGKEHEEEGGGMISL